MEAVISANVQLSLSGFARKGITRLVMALSFAGISLSLFS
jgi:hypothetical protein